MTTEAIRKWKAFAESDTETEWHETVGDEHIRFIEDQLDIEMPKALADCYTQISNGGFGPGYKLIGLPGGHPSSWGDIVISTELMREDDNCEDSWLPIIDWGCAQFSLLDCSGDDNLITLYDGDFHHEEYTFADLMNKWTEGLVPALENGGFVPNQW